MHFLCEFLYIDTFLFELLASLKCFPYSLDNEHFSEDSYDVSFSHFRNPCVRSIQYLP